MSEKFCKPSYDIRHFAEHLVQVNQLAAVVFTDAVESATGEPLVAAGQPMDDKARQLLIAQPDAPDFLSRISVAGGLTANQLVDDIKAYIEADPALLNFSKVHFDFDDLKPLANRLDECQPIIVQLSVMKIQLPMVYAQALFCAWLGALLMRQLKRSDNDVFYVFLLALVHDIGLLHVPVEYVKSRKQFNYKQLQVLQLHTLAGFEVLKAISNIPEATLRSVAEHHENLDGTGYPAGKVGNSISRFGQCLNFLDAINAIYNKRIKPGERPMRDLIPMIQMNGHSRFGVLGKKLIEWLKGMPAPKVRAVPNVLMPFLIQSVRDRNGYITSCVDIMDKLSADIGFRHGDARVFALQNTIIHINISITQSGIINIAYMRWLDQVEAEGLAHAYREVEDVFLMMQEVIYHIGKLKNQIEYFLTTPCESSEAYKLKRGLERLERVVLPQIHPNLEILWIANVH
ncbi:MAG TPA: HD domain-containing phosphohydrolase [Marinagarivorans sp.]